MQLLLTNVDVVLSAIPVFSLFWDDLFLSFYLCCGNWFFLTLKFAMQEYNFFLFELLGDK